VERSFRSVSRDPRQGRLHTFQRRDETLSNLSLCHGLIENIPSREFSMGILVDIAPLRYSIPGAKDGSVAHPKCLDDFGPGPDIECPFAFFMRMLRIDHAVCVLGAIEGAFGVGQISLHVGKNLSRYLRERLFPRNLISL